MVITQNGEAKAVVQNIESFERDQETMALLKILALGNRQIERREVEPASAAGTISVPLAQLAAPEGLSAYLP